MSQPPVTPGPEQPAYDPLAGQPYLPQSPAAPYTGPPAPHSYGTYPPPPPGAFSPPPRKRSFWSSTGGVFTIIGICFGGVVLLCVGFAVIGAVTDGAAASKMDAKITSCDFTGGPLSSATVGISVTNNGNSTRTARVKIEYRDSGGNRIDTDTAYVRDVRPGDTARVEETTILDAEVTSAGSCRIVEVS